ncbi:MAG TPA: sulfotransferase [Rhodanobacteraceae bacterium]|nr:sulfotransferase [Rhodanobacteraceae bacterium]
MSDDVTSGAKTDSTVSSAGASLSPVARRLLARARSEWEASQFDAAERSLGSVLALAPHEPRAVRMLGMVARSRGDYAKAVDCFRAVLAVWPGDVFLRTELGLSLLALGEAREATEHFRHACERAPDSESAWFNLGEALWQQARGEEAVTALQKSLALEPRHIQARISLARAYAGLGRADAAVTEFREVVRRDPVNADGWYGLSLNTVLNATDAAHLQQLFARTGLPVRAHYLLGFALAKALEDQRDFTRAFEVLLEANASQRAGMRMKWDAAEERQFVDAIRTTFADAVSSSPDTAAGKEAILITGMPRSGSTLVEQILASHHDVEGANEISDMLQLINAESRRRGSAFPLWTPDATAHDWQWLGQEYLARTACWRATKPRFTDKNLLGWHYVGAALAMLPAARVIIVRRDPVETCLACYRHSFTDAAGFACDLDDLADYCTGFLRLTRFWLEKFPAQVFDLQYEALVANPEGVIRRMLDFCGLPFDPACLEPHKTARAVLTPSAPQVRQPLHRGSARSAHYGDKLDRLRQRLQDAGMQIE